MPVPGHLEAVFEEDFHVDGIEDFAGFFPEIGRDIREVEVVAVAHTQAVYLKQVTNTLRTPKIAKFQ